MAECKRNTITNPTGPSSIPLSAAIAAGSKSLKPHSDVRLSNETPGLGCALKMACVGAGIEPGYTAMLEHWPWLGQQAAAPCDCNRNPLHTSVLLTLAHVFDVHVMRKRDRYLADVIAWVRSIEPSHKRPRFTSMLTSADRHFLRELRISVRQGERHGN